jgi:hypothetical protein
LVAAHVHRDLASSGFRFDLLFWSAAPVRPARPLPSTVYALAGRARASYGHSLLRPLQ